MKNSFVLAQPSRDEDDEPITLGPFGFFRLMRRLFAYTHPHAMKRNQLIALVIIRSVQLPMLAWALGAVINGPIARGDLHGTLRAALWFAALAAFTQACFYFRVRLALELGEAVIFDLRNELFAHLQTMTARFYDKVKPGRIISRMTSDVEAIRAGVQDVVFVSVVQAGQMLISGLLMLWYNWALFLVVLAIAPVIWAINRYFRSRLAYTQRQAQESFSRVISTVAESVEGIRVTQGFSRQDVNASMFRELAGDHARFVMGAARTSAVFLPLLELNSQFFIAMLLLMGGYRVLNPAIADPIGDIVQFFFLAALFFDPVRIIGAQYTTALTAMVGAERVFTLLDQKPDWQDPADAIPLPDISGRVEFRDVSFGYEPNLTVLRNINFTAEPGRTIALVGHTGSGKTSITALIAKAYLPTAGALLIDGRDIRSIRSESLRRRLGIVQQQNFLFEGDVLQNIRFGRPGAGDDEVLEAVRKLDFLDMIEALPDGFRTPVGEGGSGLSVGQRQLICFARALLADPRILILDEATSSIDAITEARIQHSLAALLRGRTSFVIAHRLSTVREADTILVLRRGEIVERGSHRELLALGGVYKELHNRFIAEG